MSAKRDGLGVWLVLAKWRPSSPAAIDPSPPPNLPGSLRGPGKTSDSERALTGSRPLRSLAKSAGRQADSGIDISGMPPGPLLFQVTASGRDPTDELSPAPPPALGDLTRLSCAP
jgi:hypothetical protein